ncbi:MAG: aromatic ring-hydroxylating dioxygenase subunit alpha, partial [Paracoccaceae bacterium]|nr:aromatic ring-hydroxylating dioxygenase subunit alpha [Paracoccaceae bacterium]
MSTSTDLSSVRQSIENANGLPNAHYIDPTVFAEEKDALLFSQWAGLGVAADVPEIGDAVPVEFLGMPLLMLR